MLACVAVPADAGLPRGAMLVADEQDADADTGVTIARGNAEISIEKQRIVGRADSIELRPATKDIVFKGRARVTVGSDTYEGEVVTCTSDFSRCANGAASDRPADATRANASTPPSATAPVALPVLDQDVQQPSALGAGAAATSPR